MDRDGGVAAVWGASLVYARLNALLEEELGGEIPTREELVRLDRKRKKKGSNKGWEHPHDSDEWITKMKDGRGGGVDGARGGSGGQDGDPRNLRRGSPAGGDGSPECGPSVDMSTTITRE